MDPTFNHGDYLIVDQISYRFNDPQRGEVVVFRYPKNPSQFFIKRVIALPNEKIEIRDQEIIIYNDEYPDGKILDEPYLNSSEITRSDKLNTELESGEYFVLGDNRQHSSDSRAWGTLSENNIVGRPLIRLFPPSLPPAVFPGNHQYQYQYD